LLLIAMVAHGETTQETTTNGTTHSTTYDKGKAVRHCVTYTLGRTTYTECHDG
jgi:hypothetical protein